MMKAHIASLALALYVTGASATSINNDVAQTSIMSQAVTLPAGSYTITASDGTPMVYSHTNGQAYAPGTGQPSAIALEPLTAPGSTMRIGMGNAKCISAQWNYTIGADWAGVLYACAIGSGPLVHGLVTDKQHWVFVPANGVASAATAVATVPAATNASAGAAVANVADAQVAAIANKPKVASTTSVAPAASSPPAAAAAAAKVVIAQADKVANVQPLKVADSAKVSGLEGAASHSIKSAASHKPTSGQTSSKHHKSCKSRRCRASHHYHHHRHHHHSHHHNATHHRRDVQGDAGLDKRDSSNAYYIIAYDHLSNMVTRALTKSVALSGDALNVPSWMLENWTEGDADQIFIVNPA